MSTKNPIALFLQSLNILWHPNLITWILLQNGSKLDLGQQHNYFLCSSLCNNNKGCFSLSLVDRNKAKKNISDDYNFIPYDTNKGTLIKNNHKANDTNTTSLLKRWTILHNQNYFLSRLVSPSLTLSRIVPLLIPWSFSVL